MSGTIFAVILLNVLVIAGGYALLARRERTAPQEAEPTRKGRREPFVTREELEEAIAESTKELQYEWNEWYEKFNTLHLRLSKRAKRAAQAESNGHPTPELDLEEQRPSVLSFRRMTSP